jgi:capsular polysaccharide export protein
MTAPSSPAPCVLLLQGPRSPFFARLADALTARGARVLRALVCAGDELFWRGRPALRFRGRAVDWAGWVAQTCRREGVTDVVGLGDGRFWHAEGYPAARAAGARIHVVEQGWLRPGWLTVERDALGGWRPSGAAPAGEAAAVAPSPERGAGFAAFAAMDVAHHLADMALGWLLYPHARRHELRHPVAEWAGWAARAASWPMRAAARRAALAEIAAARGPLFLAALQLETDYQIRRNGPPGGARAALGAALASFAAHAPPEARLIVKPHPLDPGLDGWRAQAAGGADSSRVIWLDGGPVEALFPRLSGVVVVNSTVGLSALAAGLPVAVQGRAVYEALAWRGDLAPFWRAPQRPDPARVAALVAALVADTQVPGAFDGPGMAAGAEGVAARILAAAQGAERAA